MTDWILMPDSIEYVLEVLEQNGFESYVVGGCVRDALLGKEPADWDVTTNALPQQIHQVFKEYPTISTGEQHGTVSVVIDGEPIEITTFRIEGDYEDHRHPSSVTFTRSLEKDLSRRDFTINAMAFHPSTGIVDLFGGINDLQQKQIRAVGDPMSRFEEDGLRILRGLRFAAQLGFSIESATETAIVQKKSLLNAISKERIRDELSKLLCAPHGVSVLRKYSFVIFTILPELQPMEHFEQNNPHHCFDVWEHTLHGLEATPPDLILRLAVLLHDSGKPKVYTQDENGIGHFYGHGEESTVISKTVLLRLRYDNRTIDQACMLVRHHDLPMQPEEKWIKRQLRRFGPETFFQLLVIHRSDTQAQSELCQPRLAIVERCESIARGILDSKSCFQLKDLAINGKDLIALGIPKGKQIGICLDYLLNLVIDDDAPNEKKALLCFAKQWHQENK